MHLLNNVLPTPDDKSARFWLDRLGFSCGITPDASHGPQCLFPIFFLSAAEIAAVSSSQWC